MPRRRPRHLNELFDCLAAYADLTGESAGLVEVLTNTAPDGLCANPTLDRANAPLIDELIARAGVNGLFELAREPLSRPQRRAVIERVAILTAADQMATATVRTLVRRQRFEPGEASELADVIANSDSLQWAAPVWREEILHRPAATALSHNEIEAALPHASVHLAVAYLSCAAPGVLDEAPVIERVVHTMALVKQWRPEISRPALVTLLSQRHDLWRELVTWYTPDLLLAAAWIVEADDPWRYRVCGLDWRGRCRRRLRGRRWWDAHYAAPSAVVDARGLLSGPFAARARHWRYGAPSAGDEPWRWTSPPADEVSLAAAVERYYHDGVQRVGFVGETSLVSRATATDEYRARGVNGRMTLSDVRSNDRILHWQLEARISPDTPAMHIAPVAAYLLDNVGTNPSALRVMLSLLDDWEGSLEDLVTTVESVIA